MYCLIDVPERLQEYERYVFLTILLQWLNHEPIVVSEAESLRLVFFLNDEITFFW